MSAKLLRFALCILSLLFFIGVSEAKIVERILVVVNDDLITKTELDDRLSRNRDMLRQLYQYDEARLSEEIEKAMPEILETMIDEILFIQEAMRRNIQISDSEIDDYIESLKKQYGSDKAFEEALNAEGYTLDSLKRERQRALLLQELIKQEFDRELDVTDEEVREFYRENRDQFPGSSDAVKLKHIFIRFNVTDADKEKARIKAEYVLTKCKEGLDFGQMALQYSDDELTRESGGDMGYFVPGVGKYNDILETAASKLALGEISPLIESPIGYEIIKVTDIKSPNVRVQRIYIAARPTLESEKAAEDKARSILEELKSGADFVDMVKNYSDDITTKDKGGDWREVPIDSMSPDLRAAFSSFNEGEISQPVKTPLGIHIFKIVGRQDLTNDEMEQLREFLRRNKLQDKLSEYSKKLREKAYIKKLADN